MKKIRFKPQTTFDKIVIFLWFYINCLHGFFIWGFNFNGFSLMLGGLVIFIPGYLIYFLSKHFFGKK